MNIILCSSLKVILSSEIKKATLDTVLYLTGDVSKEYGINRKSILNELIYFNMCNGSLIPDIMHDLLEGTLQYEVKLTSLDYLNSKVSNLELGHMESKDRPSFISMKTL